MISKIGYKTLSILLLMFIITSCEEQTDWPLETSGGDLLVVDAMITSVPKSHVVKLTRSFSDLKGEVPKVSGAQVILSDKDSSWVLKEIPANSGIYRTKHTFAAKMNRQYTLFISYNKNIYSAKAEMVKASQIVPLRYLKKNNGLYQIQWVASNYNPRKPAMYDIFLDWSKAPGYTNLPIDSCRARIKVYSLPTLDVSEVLPPEAEKLFFPAGTIITQFKYSLSEEHAAFLRALMLETSWTGGFFDSSPANLPTNMSNGAIGFFSVCEEQSLNIIVQP